MYWDIVDLSVIDHQTVFIRFADGLSGTIIFPREEMTGVFETLKDEAIFRQAHVENGTITWPGGLDLAPDGLYEDLRRANGPLVLEFESSRQVQR